GRARALGVLGRGAGAAARPAVGPRAPRARWGGAGGARPPPAASSTTSRAPGTRFSAAGCRGSSPIVSRGAPEPASVASARPRARADRPRHGAGVSPDRLGGPRLGRPRAADRRFAAPAGSAGLRLGLALRDALLPGAPPLARLHLPDLQHDSLAAHLGGDLGTRRILRPLLRGLRRRGLVARAPLDRWSALCVAVLLGGRG